MMLAFVVLLGYVVQSVSLYNVDCQDDLNCTTCRDGALKCKTGDQCIRPSDVCDGLKDCIDKSDESNCTTCPSGRPFKCKTGTTCFSENVVCNGINDCKLWYLDDRWSVHNDNSDELNCTTCKDSAVMCGCSFNQSTCKPTGQCIERSQLVDGVQHCKDGEDEPCLRFVNYLWHCLNEIRKDTLMSYIDDLTCVEKFGPCGDRRDERCETGEWLCSDGSLDYFYQREDGRYGSEYFRCLESILYETSRLGLKCVTSQRYSSQLHITERYITCLLPQSNIYDEIAQCGDESDICFVDGQFVCFLCLDKRLVVSQQQVCDGVADCYDLSDECLCDDQTVCQDILGDARETCPPNQMHCYSTTDCVDIDKVLCNPEVSCARQSTIPCSTSQKQNSQDQNTTVCGTYVYESGGLNGFALIGHIMGTKCNGRPECPNFQDECLDCEDRPPFCDDSCSMKNDETVCRGYIDPNTGEAFCNETRKNLCPKRHNCRNDKVYTSIDVDQVCDGIIHCDDGSDELKSMCKDTKFYCDIKEPLSVDIDLVEDGLQQCSDGSDECPDVSKYDTVFSNVKEMIANPFFRAMFWVMGFLAGGGNFIVFVNTIKEMVTDKKAKVIKKMNDLFIINLSCADFLMGVYLLGIAAKGVQLSGNYCLNDAAWRTSDTCNILGFIALFASEASALILATMTACRLYTVCNPFATRTLKLKWAYLSCITVWASSFLLGAIPLFYYPSGYFTSHVWFPNLFHKTDRVPRNETLLLAKRIMKENFTDLPWYEVKQLISSTFPQYPIKGEFGYFGETSVCMPRLFASVNEASWQYSIFLISLNFVLFIVMLISYLAIYIKSNKMSKAKKKQANTKMQRRISRLLITDFCCWIPLCTCGFLAVSGVPLTNDIYIVSAGILLPINSALNPLLYSNLFDNFYIRCKRLVIAKNQNPKSEVEANVK